MQSERIDICPICGKEIKGEIIIKDRILPKGFDICVTLMDKNGEIKDICSDCVKKIIKK